MKTLRNLIGSASEEQPGPFHAGLAVSLTTPSGAMQQVQLGLTGALVMANGKSVWIPIEEIAKAAGLAEPQLEASTDLTLKPKAAVPKKPKAK